MTDPVPLLRAVGDTRPAYTPRDVLGIIREALADHPDVAEMQRVPTRASSGSLVETLVITLRDGHSVFLDAEGERP